MSEAIKWIMLGMLFAHMISAEVAIDKLKKEATAKCLNTS